MSAGVVAAVDDHGTVQLAGRGWTVEWWIGAEDRWHRSGAEVGVRQERLGPGPVLETAMRVPGGDVLARVGAAEVDGSVVAVEFENRSAVPVALAVVLRPFSLGGPGRAHRVRVDSSTMWVDDEPALVLDRLPAAVVVGDAGDDLCDRLDADATQAADATEHVCAAGMATVAAVVPLAHTAVARMVLGAADGRVLARVPTVAQVAQGWSAHLVGAELDLPEGLDQAQLDLATVVLAARNLPDWAFADRAVTVDDQARVLEALVRSGHPTGAAEVDRWLAATGVPARHAGAAAMVVTRAALDADPNWFDEYLGWAADSIGRGLDHGDADAGRAAAALAALLDRTSQPDAARRVAQGWQPAPVVAELDVVGVVDPSAAATRIIRRLGAVVADRPDGADLLSDVPAAWLGRSIDVRDAPTAHGPVSFSVRWHGARPALLWERQPWPGAASWTVRCPGLDPTWSSTDDRGEALLAEPDDGSARLARSVE
ncbi:MAG: hypothetical protein OES57_01690 [Acidimicrobiia bacterium]|nr:hypothetical protein [Acidimicrobiia bacterium]